MFRRYCVGAVLSSVLALVASPPVEATSPGHNGNIVACSYTSKHQKTAALYSYDPRKKFPHNATLLTTPEPAEVCINPDISPDGRTVIWNYEVDGGSANDQVYSLDLVHSGAQPVQLTHDLYLDYRPLWSPDGQLIAYMRYTEKLEYEVVVMRPDGSGAHIIGTSTTSMSFDWAPSSKKLVVSDGRNLTIVNTAGTPLAQIGKGQAPTWSPDGSTLAFCVANDNTRSQIYTSDSAGHHRTNVSSTNSFDFAPTWSPDGKRLAFLRWHNKTSDDQRAWIMNPDGTGQVAISPTTRTARDAKWSPDSTMLGFTLDKSPGWEIWVAPIAHPTQLTLITPNSDDLAGSWEIGTTLAWRIAPPSK